MSNKEESFETRWKHSKKVMLSGMVPEDIWNFVEREAIKDFGIKKGARGMTLTKLLEIARDCLEKQEAQ